MSRSEQGSLVLASCCNDPVHAGGQLCCMISLLVQVSCIQALRPSPHLHAAQVFCLAFQLLDHEWLALQACTGADASDVSHWGELNLAAALSLVRKHLGKALRQRPADLNALRRLLRV